MKITKNNAGIPEGTFVLLPSEELLIIKQIINASCGVFYKVQFVEEDGDEYIPIGDLRVISRSDLIGGEY